MGLTFRLGTIPLAILTDASNNVGIGAAPSGSYKLEVTGTAKVSSTLLVSGAATFASTLDTAGTITSTVGATNTSLLLKRTGTTFECVVQDNQSRIRTFGASGNDKDLLFDTDNAGTTRMRITSGGVVLVNLTATSSYLDGKISAYGNSTVPAACFKNDGNGQFTTSVWNAGVGGGTAVLIQFVYGSGASTVGNIVYNGTNTILNPTSDQRLKENIVDAGSGLAKLSKVKIRAYDWKQSGMHTDFGIVAQEIYESAPECVTVGSDEVDENGNLKNPWCAQPYVLVSAAVKAIQELNQIVQEQNQTIQELYNRLNKAGL